MKVADHRILGFFIASCLYTIHLTFASASEATPAFKRFNGLVSTVIWNHGTWPRYYLSTFGTTSWSYILQDFIQKAVTTSHKDHDEHSWAFPGKCMESWPKIAFNIWFAKDLDDFLSLRSNEGHSIFIICSTSNRPIAFVIQSLLSKTWLKPPEHIWCRSFIFSMLSSVHVF